MPYNALLTNIESTTIENIKIWHKSNCDQIFRVGATVRSLRASISIRLSTWKTSCWSTGGTTSPWRTLSPNRCNSRSSLDRCLLPPWSVTTQNSIDNWEIKFVFPPVRLSVCFGAAHLLALPTRPGLPPAPGQRPDRRGPPAVPSPPPAPGSPANTAATGQTAQRPHWGESQTNQPPVKYRHTRPNCKLKSRKRKYGLKSPYWLRLILSQERLFWSCESSSGARQATCPSSTRRLGLTRAPDDPWWASGDPLGPPVAQLLARPLLLHPLSVHSQEQLVLRIQLPLAVRAPTCTGCSAPASRPLLSC